MINKKILLLFFAGLFLISFVAMGSATATINQTVSNFTNISGSAYQLNATIYGGGATAGTNSTSNVSFYYKPLSYNIPGNDTWFLIGTKTNQTVDQWYFNITWDTTEIADGTDYTINVTAYNVTATINASNRTGNITIDNTAPTTIAYTGAALTTYPNGTSIKTAVTLANNLTLNISVTDATIGMANVSNAFCYVNVDGKYNHTIPFTDDQWCNSSDINITGLTDGNKTINIYVNDSLNNLRLNSTLVVQIDTTAPTATATCSPSTSYVGDSFPCTCSASDATSGLASSGGSSTSPNAVTAVPSSTGVFTYTCSATDYAGFTTSATAIYTITQSPGSGTTGGSSTATTTPAKIQSFTKITPGAATVMKDFNAATGVKQIEITVNNEAQNVKVTVTKYDGRPADVSVSKTGKVYQYLQIKTENLADKLNKAIVQFKVSKTWASENNLEKEKIVVSKFDETADKWNELTTTYSSEDTNYYYYDVELTSFSYFAIAEKSTVTGAAGDEGGAAGDAATGAGSSLTWLWILIGVVALAIIAWLVFKKK